MGENPNTLAATNNLATLLKKRGKLGKRKLFIENLAVEGKLGWEHPDTLDSINLARAVQTRQSLQKQSISFGNGRKKKVQGKAPKALVSLSTSKSRPRTSWRKRNLCIECVW